MMETQLWHPVVAAQDLDRAPVAAALLETELALWRDSQGVVHAWADRCPHRGAKFSLGRVVEDRLECGYHGWQFATDGRCRFVPALPAFSPPASHCAQVYEAREAYGLIWVRLGQSASEIPVFAAESDARLRKVNCGPYLVQTSAPRLVENFLDMSHFGFVHEGWLGDRAHVAMQDYEVHKTTTGILATNCQAWQPKSNLHSATGSMVDYTYEVNAPYTCILTKAPDPSTLGAHIVDKSSFRESIALFVCPITPETSRVWIRMAMTDFESPDSALQNFQNTIFGQDQPVLESQSPKRLPLDLRAELHTVADKASSSYRRYLSEQGITFGVC
ncbi:MAG: aromatic ring-hydroxylating dioxygenase subunit alpha [Brachymonas sp.]|nr:aromatic ring-hydroxylating dioxygenase subunit alpha [Brachymonas sp.]